MNTEQDRYDITTFDSTGAPDLLITNLTEKIANSWVTELEADGVNFEITLREVA